MKNQLYFAIKIVSIISSIPLALLLVYGKSFYSLWMPTQDARILQILSVLAVGTLFISSAIKPLYAVYIVTNRVRLNSITSLFQGIISTITVVMLIKLLPHDIVYDTFNPWGLYIIAGTSSILGIIRSLTITPVQAARCMGLKWTAFYGVILRSLMAIVLECIVIYFFSLFIPSNNWLMLGVSVVSSGIIVLLIAFFIILKQSERFFLTSKVINLLKKKINNNHGKE